MDQQITQPVAAPAPTPVPAKETSRSGRSAGKKILGCLPVLVILAVVVAFFAFIFNFIDTTATIVPADNSLCKSNTFCLKINTEYQDGWALWRPNQSFPSLFSMTTGGYTNGDKLLITCPMNYSTSDISLVAKIKFFFSNADVQKCTIAKV